MQKPDSIDAYIAGFPENTQKQLSHLRSLIAAHAPGAVEVISYAMPAFRLGRILVYFAGYKGHIGFYPSGSAINHFKDRLQGYVFSKGAVRFPLDKPLPESLISDIVKYRVAENTKG